MASSFACTPTAAGPTGLGLLGEWAQVGLRFLRGFPFIRILIQIFTVMD
jgi:hypothetical protein